MTPDELLPQVYDELRRLATAKMRNESDGHTLDATALVNEVWLKLNQESFGSKTAFIRAAAISMRRILINHARDQKRLKRGGERIRIELLDQAGAVAEDPDLVLTLDELLTRLAQEDPMSAQVAEYHLFAGLSVEEAGESLGISRPTAYRNWKYARAWIREALSPVDNGSMISDTNRNRS